MDPCPRLPWELFECILEEFGSCKLDSAALASCALVCRLFHFKASGYLFSDIVVTKIGAESDHARTAKRLKDLHHIFTANETLAPRVRSFKIATSIGPVEPRVGRASILSDRHLGRILTALTALHHFGWSNYRLEFPWDALSDSIRIALRTVFACPTLRSLALECMSSVSPADIAECTGLTNLRLMHVDPPPEQDAPLGAPALRLESLTEYNSPRMVAALLGGAAPLAGLRTLSVWMRHDEQVAAAWALMQRVAPTLETLNIPELSHFRYPTLVPGPVDIGILTRLRSLSLGCRLTTLDRVVFPLGVAGILQAPMRPTRLERLALRLDWVDCAVGSEEARFLSEPGWGALDDALARGEVYPALRAVELTLHMGYRWVEDEDGRPPEGVVRMKEKVERLAGRLLAKVAASGAAKVSVNLFLYKSIYASDMSQI